MNITQDIIPKGARNRPGFKNSMTYVTIHETGNASKGANAKAHASALKGSYGQNTPASWHYSVDDLSIYQHLPDNETGYHTGDGAKGQGTKTGISGGGALNSIGIEICVNSDGNYAKAVENAAWLTATLCKKHGIPLSHVVQHNFWKSNTHPTGKNCPQNLRAGKQGGWDGFVDRVQALLTPAQPLTPANLRVSNEDGVLRVRYSKVPEVDGYQVQVSTSNVFAAEKSGSKNYDSYTKNLVKTCAGEPLVCGTTYYVRVRCYVLVDEEKVWGAYSPSASVKKE